MCVDETNCQGSCSECQLIQTGTEPKFQVGQKVYIVPNDTRYHGQADHYEITKIGRKWITYTKYRRENRFDPVTMQVDGGPNFSSPAKVYMSKEEFEESVEIRKLWTTLKQTIGYGHVPTPKHLTRKDLEEIIQKLKGI